MSRRVLDKKNSDDSNLEFLDTDRKFTSQWTSSSSNEESCTDLRSEILWSREKNTVFSEKDIFRNFPDDFSDVTERSTSSCSWHNDDFDMNSCNKVKASLEAIENALYEKQPSHLISKSVFQECCDWANKFPFFRLKGEQIIKPLDDGASLCASLQEIETYSPENLSLSLKVEGKKMAIRVPDKFCKKSTPDIVPQPTDIPDYFEEIFDDDGEYEECFGANASWDDSKKETHYEYNSASINISSAESIQEKVIERIALEMWPKVLAILEAVEETQTKYMSEDFQLPPIVPTGESRQYSLQRPKTEGTDLAADFPKLSSFLSISPKILQNRKEYGNWGSSLRPSRPNSEIHLSHQNHISSFKYKNEPLKICNILSQQNNARQVELTSTKMMIKEGNLLLPALDEDIQDSSNALQNFYEESEMKEITSTACTIQKLSRKSDSFLPPIDGKSLVSSNAKLTRNLFTLFGPPLKYERGRRIGSAAKKPCTPVSRPNTSSSRKVFKYSGNVPHKLLNDGNSSINNSTCMDVKKLNDITPEKQVTLFPIVTSLVPCKERNCSAVKKGLLNSYGARKR